MISYRKVEEKDKKDFIEIERLFYKFYADLGINKHLKPIPPEQIPEKNLEESFSQSLNEEYFFLAADNGERMIGYIFAEIKNIDTPYAYEVKDVGFIDSIFILEEYRGQGIGKELIKKAEEWIISKGCKICTIGVRNENPDALSLYESLGFKKANIKMWKEI